MALLRGYHLGGHLDRAAQAAEQLLEVMQGLQSDPQQVTGVFDQYCWILSDAGKPELALRKLDDFLLEKGKVRIGFPRLILARCRLHLALRRQTEAETDLQEFFHADNVKLAGEHDYAEAWMIRGFLAAARGDQVGAHRAWREGFLRAQVPSPSRRTLPTSLQYLSSLSDPYFFSALLAGGLADEVTEAAAAEALEEVTARSQGRALWDTITRITPLPGNLLRDMVRTERGRACARQVAFRNLTYGDYLRLPREMMIADLIRRSIFPKGISRDQDDLVWNLVNDLLVAHMKGQLTTKQLRDLGLAWKGASGNLGWAAVEKSLEPDIHSACAYMLGLRYLQLDKRDVAFRFFATARDNASAGSLLRRIVDAEYGPPGRR